MHGNAAPLPSWLADHDGFADALCVMKREWVLTDHAMAAAKQVAEIATLLTDPPPLSSNAAELMRMAAATITTATNPTQLTAELRFVVAVWLINQGQPVFDDGQLTAFGYRSIMDLASAAHGWSRGVNRPSGWLDIWEIAQIVGTDHDGKHKRMRRILAALALTALADDIDPYQARGGNAMTDTTEQPKQCPLCNSPLRRGKYEYEGSWWVCTGCDAHLSPAYLDSKAKRSSPK